MSPALRLALAAIVLVVPACKKEEKKPEPDSISAMVASIIADAGGGGTNPDAMAKGARDQFGEKFSCPSDRVEAKRRTDLEGASASTAQPPDEVKNDPGRYEKWKADQEKDQARRDRTASEHQKFEINGCGHTQLVDCRPHHGPNGAVYPNSADCNEIKDPSARHL
jgi:hypothetical protein